MEGRAREKKVAGGGQEVVVVQGVAEEEGEGSEGGGAGVGGVAGLLPLRDAVLLVRWFQRDRDRKRDADGDRDGDGDGDRDRDRKRDGDGDRDKDRDGARETETEPTPCPELCAELSRTSSRAQQVNKSLEDLSFSDPTAALRFQVCLFIVRVCVCVRVTQVLALTPSF